MYKIYINEQCLILCLSDEVFHLNSTAKDAITVAFRGQKKQFFPYIDSLEKQRGDRVIIFHSEDVKKMFLIFKSIFRVIKAAGGVVHNGQKILFIFRRGHWDLPKGKIDEGEKKREAALREVREETGIQQLEIFGKIGKTYHVYRDKKNNRCLKITHWFNMTSTDLVLKPQTEEDIVLALWESLENIAKRPESMYASIEEIMQIQMNQKV